MLREPKANGGNDMEIPVAPLLHIGLRKQLPAAMRNFLLEHHIPALLRRGNEKPTTRVAMFHMSRCGSTVLGQMLAAQGEIFWAGEVFANMPNRYAKLMRSLTPVGRILDRSLAEPESLRSLVRRSDYPPRYRV